MSPFAQPTDTPCIRHVGNFHELATTPLAHGINALCWERTLPGDYAEVVRLLGDGEGEPITTLDEDTLLALPVGPAGRLAVAQMLADFRRLRDHDLDPALNCIHGYPRDEAPGPVATDVFSFHADSAPFEAYTWLCTYAGPPSDGLRPADALRKVDDPAIRAALLALYGGPDDADFKVFLSENCYDLHYAPKPGAQPYSFGVGHLWRIATDYPGNPVPPCVHRAPATRPGDPARLLLIA
jgi:hypothetical protein